VTEENEILRAARDAKAREEAAKANRGSRRWPLAKIGLGVGIGSAAVAAAVLFANRDRDRD
jgi:hypothetical protein